MFLYKRKIFLKDTDATGVIYFGALLQYALEAFEVFLHEKEKPLSQMFSQGYLFPIVHVEADYKLPLCVGDEVSITLALQSIGKRSFTLECLMQKEPLLGVAGVTKIVHAFLRKGGEKACPLPTELVDFLKEQLPQENDANRE